MSRRARLTLVLLCLAAALLPATAAASQGGYSPDEATRALRAAEVALSPPVTLSAGPPAAAPEATLALRELAIALPALEGEERTQAEEILKRPTDKNDRNFFGEEADESPLCDENFCVHWSESKSNAPVDDEFVGQVAAAAARSFAVENGTLGWQEPRSDGARGARAGEGGEGQTDIYITDLERGLYGYATPDPGQGGARRFAYLVLDNSYTGFPSPPTESMQVTVAHEYNHVLQFSYDLFQDLWMFESTATWVEEYVFGDINDYLNYLPAFARAPQTPLTGEGIEIYAEAVWNHWLAARYTPDVVRQAWAGSVEAKPPHFAPAAYGDAIGLGGGGTFAEEFGDFAAATAEWRSAALVFPDAARYPDMKRAATLGARARRLTLDNTSYQLFDVRASGANAALRVRAPRGVRSTVALVGRVGPVDSGAVTVRSRHLPKGGAGKVVLESPASYDRVTALVINGDAKRGRRGYASNGSRYRVRLRG